MQAQAVLTLQESTEAHVETFQDKRTQTVFDEYGYGADVSLALEFHYIVGAIVSSENHIPQRTYTQM